MHNGSIAGKKKTYPAGYNLGAHLRRRRVGNCKEPSKFRVNRDAAEFVCRAAPTPHVGPVPERTKTIPKSVSDDISLPCLNSLVVDAPYARVPRCFVVRRPRVSRLSRAPKWDLTPAGVEACPSGAGLQCAPRDVARACSKFLDGGLALRLRRGDPGVARVRPRWCQVPAVSWFKQRNRQCPKSENGRPKTGK